MTSLIQLQSLWNFEESQLENEIEEFIREWNAEHKCRCCKNWREGDRLIECVHVEKEKIKKFGERNATQLKNLFLLRAFALKQVIKN